MNIRFALTLPALLCASVASADVLYDEAISGDLSGDRFNPTQGGVLALGSNTLTASVVVDDLDFITFNVPAGSELAAVTLTAFDSTLGNRAFMGIQAGSIFTLDPGAPNPAELLGYVLFGSDQLGADLLPAMGSAAGAMGFSGSLPAGDYTLWIQETSQDQDTFTLDFVTVPSPSAAAVLLAAGGMLQRRRR